MLSRVVTLSLLCLGVAPVIASAGWVSEWENTPIHNGERLDSERSTMRIANDKMRIDQPQIVSIFDYSKGTMTLMNPSAKVFWTGSVDEYSEETSKTRNRTLRDRIGKDAAKVEDFTVDLNDLPEIKVEKTDEAKKIADHPTLKYVVLVNDELFQEIWLTEDFNTNSDLNVGKFLDFQRRSSARMVGKSAKPFNALYRSKAYEEFLGKGFAMQVIIHHIAGGFERRVISIEETEVYGSAFVVPEGYRKVTIPDIFPKEPKD